MVVRDTGPLQAVASHVRSVASPPIDGPFLGEVLGRGELVPIALGTELLRTVKAAAGESSSARPRSPSNECLNICAVIWSVNSRESLRKSVHEYCVGAVLVTFPSKATRSCVVA